MTVKSVDDILLIYSFYVLCRLIHNENLYLQR